MRSCIPWNYVQSLAATGTLNVFYEGRPTWLLLFSVEGVLMSALDPVHRP